jgi:hypothetical protein
LEPLYKLPFACFEEEPYWWGPGADLLLQSRMRGSAVQSSTETMNECVMPEKKQQGMNMNQQRMIAHHSVFSASSGKNDYLKQKCNDDKASSRRADLQQSGSSG